MNHPPVDLSVPARRRRQVVTAATTGAVTVGLALMLAMQFPLQLTEWLLRIAFFVPKSTRLIVLLLLVIAAMYAIARSRRIRFGDPLAALLIAVGMATGAVLTLVSMAALGADTDASHAQLFRGFAEVLGETLAVLVVVPEYALGFLIPATLVFRHLPASRNRVGGSLTRSLLAILAAIEAHVVLAFILLHCLAASVAPWTIGGCVMLALFVAPLPGVVHVLRTWWPGKGSFPPRFSPWRHDGDRQRIRLFAGVHRTRVAALLVPAIVLGVAGWAFVKAPVPENYPVSKVPRFIFATYLAGSVALFMAALLYARARRWANLSAAEVRNRDERRPILYLRSFKDDRLRLATPALANPRRSWIERFLLRSSERFEEVLVWHLWRLGPVIGVGRPRERLAPLGAAREYLDTDEWLIDVEKHMREARLVVIVLGRTDGLRAEVERLVELGLTEKLLVVVPPVGKRERTRRWKSFEELTHGAQLPPVPSESVSRIVAIRFSAAGSSTVMVGRRLDEWHYELALEADTAPDTPTISAAPADRRERQSARKASDSA